VIGREPAGATGRLGGVLADLAADQADLSTCVAVSGAAAVLRLA
jgi:hypothetical protein